MPREKWIDISGYEGNYQVSNLGRVKSVERTYQNSYEKKPRRVKEKFLKLIPNSNGYLRVFLSKQSKVSTFYVHRLVAQHFCDKEFEHVEVNHIDGDKLNNRQSNLEWCTKNQNLNHAFENNLCKWGEQSNLRTLTENQVQDIRLDIAKGLKVTDIAAKYQVNRSSIFRIKSGKSWRRLPSKLKEVK